MSKDSVCVEIPYGEKLVQAFMPKDNLMAVCQPEYLAEVKDEVKAIQISIDKSWNATQLQNLGSQKKAAIAITDRTRVTPNGKILPILLNKLNEAEVADENISILIGTGMHAPDTQADIETNVGKEIASRVKVIVNDPFKKKDFAAVGYTSFGTPVEVQRLYVTADCKIVTGNITPCLMAGWTGGAKTVLPGICSKETIYANHMLSMIQLEKANRGSMLGILPPENIVRRDIEEAAALAGVDLTLNSVLNTNDKIVEFLAGDFISVHRSGVAMLEKAMSLPIGAKADVIIAGVGSFGFSISLYQGASRVLQGIEDLIRPGGTIIIPCQCREGIYEGILKEVYTQWMQKMPSPEEIRELTAKGILPPEEGVVLYVFSWIIHKLNCKIVVVTDGMTEEELRQVHMGYAANLQQAIDDTLAELAPTSKVLVLPYAAMMLPKHG